MLKRQRAFEIARIDHAGSYVCKTTGNDRAATAGGTLSQELPPRLASHSINGEHIRPIGLDKHQVWRESCRGVVKAPRGMPQRFAGAGIKQVEALVFGQKHAASHDVAVAHQSTVRKD